MEKRQRSLHPKLYMKGQLIFQVFPQLVPQKTNIPQKISFYSFILLVSKITADGDCSHEIKRHLLLGRKPMTNIDSLLKSRDISLPTKIHLIKAMVFSVVMYECESWTIKKAEHQRTDAFELWCWRRLLRVPGLQGDQTSQS